MKKTYLIIFVLVLLAVVMFLLNHNKISLISVTPFSSAANIDLLSPIILNFDKTIDPSLVTLTIVPTQQFSVTTNQNQLIFQPQQPFLPQTNYQTSISLKHKNIYSFSFKTRQLTLVEINDLGKDQAMSDYLYAAAQAEYIQKNPFITKLPLETPQFRASYDYGKKQIRIRLLIPVINSDEKSQFTDNAIAALKSGGVDAAKIGFYVLEAED